MIAKEVEKKRIGVLVKVRILWLIMDLKRDMKRKEVEIGYYKGRFDVVVGLWKRG